MEFRRLVTAETGTGYEAEWHIEPVAPTEVGQFRVFDLWGWDTPPTLPYTGTAHYEASSSFPTPEGVRVCGFVFPPGYPGTQSDGEGEAVDYAAITAARSTFRDAVSHGRVYGDEDGMHRTDTIDIAFVLQGEITCKLPGGGEQVMKPGDVYVQNGAMHLWRNDSDQEAIMVNVKMRAERTGAS